MCTFGVIDTRTTQEEAERLCGRKFQRSATTHQTMLSSEILRDKDVFCEVIVLLPAGDSFVGRAPFEEVLLRLTCRSPRRGHEKQGLRRIMAERHLSAV